MTGRTPACEDSGIGARLREIQAERLARIAGCACEQHDTSGNVVHGPTCPLRAPPQAALALAVAMERLRARASRRATDAAAQARLPLPTAACPAERYLDHIERAVAEKVARHRIIYPQAEEER